MLKEILKVKREGDHQLIGNSQWEDQVNMSKSTLSMFLLLPQRLPILAVSNELLKELGCKNSCKMKNSNYFLLIF